MRSRPKPSAAPTGLGAGDRLYTECRTSGVRGLVEGCRLVFQAPGEGQRPTGGGEEAGEEDRGAAAADPRPWKLAWPMRSLCRTLKLGQVAAEAGATAVSARAARAAHTARPKVMATRFE